MERNLIEIPTKDHHYQVGQWACFRCRRDASRALKIPVRTLDARIYRGEYGKHESQHKYRKVYEKGARSKLKTKKVDNHAGIINTMWKPVRRKCESNETETSKKGIM